MKLTYRGVSAQPQPRALATKKTNIVANFSNPLTGVETPVSKRVVKCNLVPKWICSQDSYPRCVAQWVTKCQEIAQE